MVISVFVVHCHFMLEFSGHTDLRWRRRLTTAQSESCPMCVCTLVAEQTRNTLFVKEKCRFLRLASLMFCGAVGARGLISDNLANGLLSFVGNSPVLDQLAGLENAGNSLVCSNTYSAPTLLPAGHPGHHVPPGIGSTVRDSINFPMLCHTRNLFVDWQNLWPLLAKP